MGRFLIRVDTDQGPRYLDYSTIVDAPITNGMTREECSAYLLEENGRRYEHEIEPSIARADAHGTSCRSATSATEAILCNRAGPNETKATLAEIVERYCPGLHLKLGPAIVKRDGAAYSDALLRAIIDECPLIHNLAAKTRSYVMQRTGARANPEHVAKLVSEAEILAKEEIRAAGRARGFEPTV